MKSRRRSTSSQGIHEVNMTSLIDVSLVLVVILLVTTPFAFQSSILVRSSVAAGRTAAVETQSERVEIEILSADSLVINRLPVSRSRLTETLTPLLAGTATRAVIVRCGGSVPHGAFVSILDDAKQCGASDIAILGE